MVSKAPHSRLGRPSGPPIAPWNTLHVFHSADRPCDYFSAPEK